MPDKENLELNNKGLCRSVGRCCGRGFMVLLALAGTAYLVVLSLNAWKARDFIGRPVPQRDTIAISAEGKVTAIPDIATVSIGVQIEKKQVSEAQAENTRKMNAIVERIKAAGVAKEDLRTSSYAIWPQYDYLDGRQVLRGYQVSQSVDVKIRNLDAIGGILAAAGELGANTVSGVSFTIDEPEKIREQARLKALESAKSKAETLAQAAGAKLGKIVSFSESSSDGNPQPPLYYAKDSAAGVGGGSPNIESGSQEVVVYVTVSYELLP